MDSPVYSPVLSKLFRGALLAAAIAAAPCASLPAQVPLRDVPKPVKEIEEPFTLITSIHEMKGGRVLVADAAEQQVSWVDFATGTLTKLGRQGAGPGEYSAPAGIFRLAGDTIWIFDQLGQSGRFVSFLPDGKPGTTFPFISFNTADSSQIAQPLIDARGMVYAMAVPLKIAGGGDAAAAGGARANIQLADSSTLVRFDPRVVNGPRTKVARLKFFTSGGGRGGMTQQVVGTNIKMTMAYLGMNTGDTFALFNDGRIAIVRGTTYRVDFITPSGAPGVSATIPYEHVKVTAADHELEMNAARRVVKDQMVMVKKMLPAGYTLEFEMTPPVSWPAEYPPVNASGVRPAPDGRLWVQRFVPERIGREQWDVIDAAGKLVARWQLPANVRLLGLGENGVVYAARKDNDDLLYLQRIQLPR
ncbi:MAG TPA: hypothetical protein VE967_11040 [Gemmatimonadaceae bacterium]|nr:hypothetical protein [Gemmatimonadaceae bacterium]